MFNRQSKGCIETDARFWNSLTAAMEMQQSPLLLGVFLAERKKEMTKSEQAKAFRDDINAVCVRHLNEFDISVDEMVYALHCQIVLLVYESVKAELNDGDYEGCSATPA